MNDPFLGTWRLNAARSKFDAHHQPPNGTMTFEREAEVGYLKQAHMIKPGGEVVTEDGSLVGEGEYVASEVGQPLTATTAGFDTQLRQFTIQTAWDRV